MPVRLLSSPVLRWVSEEEVKRALQEWAKKVRKKHPEIVRIGYFGSYARGDWGVGSDIDLIIVVKSSDKPFIERALEFDTTDLPLPADLLVYTEEELERLKGNAFYEKVIKRETQWI